METGGTASVNPLAEYLESLFVDVGEDLLAVERRTFERLEEPGLIFPPCRDSDQVRCSEQEAKQLFLHRLALDHRCRFAVETPTCETHGTGTRSGNVDVSLFANGNQLSSHIEFKEMNRNDIETSLKKLIREQKLGGWFHTLGGANRGTLPSLGGKLIRCLDVLRSDLECCKPHPCLFAFCLMRKHLLLARWLTLGGDGSLDVCKQAFGELREGALYWKTYELELK